MAGVLGNELQSFLMSPQMQGVAQGLLSASGPSSQPIGLGQALGQGLQMGNQMEEQARQRSLQNLMYDMKMKEHKRKSEKDQMRQKLFEGFSDGGLTGGKGGLADMAVATGDMSVGDYLRYQQESEKDQRKLSEDTAQGTLRLKNTDQKLAGNIERIDRMLMNKEGMQGATGFQSYFPSIRGGDAANFEGDVEILAADAVLESVKQLKNEGGTLGQITERELPILEKARTGLVTAKSPEEYQAALFQYRESLNKIRGALRNQHQSAYGELPEGLAEINALPDLSVDAEAQRLGIDENVLREYMLEKGMQ